jgi:pre-mRNA-splicing factor CDC5/CEF1
MDDSVLDSMADIQQEVSTGLASLPKPKNEFDIVLPDEEEEEAEQDGVVEDIQMEEDMAEVEERRIAERQEEERRRLARRSLVLQKGLPRPFTQLLPQVYYDAVMPIEPDTADIEAMIAKEVVRLVGHDFQEDPPEHAVVVDAEQLDTRPLPQFEDEEMTLARQLVKDEVKKSARQVLSEEAMQVERKKWFLIKTKRGYQSLCAPDADSTLTRQSMQAEFKVLLILRCYVCHAAYA